MSVYGWRGKIGILLPSAGSNEPEMLKLLPPGVTIHVTRLAMKSAQEDDLIHLADKVEEAAELVSHADVGVIALNCTLGSLMKGVGYDHSIIRRIEATTGTPATTTATAVIEAFRALQVKKVVMVSPYLEKMNRLEQEFLEAQGIRVLAEKGMGLDEPRKQVAIEPAEWYRLAREMENVEADAYFVSCAGIRVVDVIDALEGDLQKPVITSNQAVIWRCLRMLSIKEPVAGYGRLLRNC